MQTVYLVKNPNTIQTNGTNKSLHIHNLDDNMYKVICKMATAKEARVTFKGALRNIPYELDGWDKKNIKKTLELLALLTN